MSKTHNVLAATSGAARLMSGILSCWRFFLLLGLILSPIQPHLRWEYDYRLVYGEREIISCHYLSAYGTTMQYFDDCAVFRLLPVDPWWREWI